MPPADQRPPLLGDATINGGQINNNELRMNVTINVNNLSSLDTQGLPGAPDSPDLPPQDITHPEGVGSTGSHRDRYNWFQPSKGGGGALKRIILRSFKLTHIPTSRRNTERPREAGIIRRSNKIYESQLLLKGRGFPLWFPQPSLRLPIPYRKKGVCIGDVGIITSDGSFDFLFNICLPQNDPINPSVLPDGFVPIYPPLEPSDVREFREFASGSFLASSSVARAYSESPASGLIFESSAVEGAILTMPDGAYHEELSNIFGFRTYIATHARNWYKFANGRRGREAKNGDVHLVVGSDKTTKWGMATFANHSQTKLQLKFKAPEQRPIGSGCAHFWEHSAMAEARVGPEEGENNGLGEDHQFPLRNQSLFVRTLNVTLANGVWENLDLELLAAHQHKSSDSGYHPGPGYSSQPHGPGGEGSSSFHDTPSSQYGHQLSSKLPGGGKEDFDLGSTHDSVIVTDFTPAPYTVHPSQVLNRFLLSQRPGATMVITHDRDWYSTLTHEDTDFPGSSALLQRVQILNDILEDNGVVYLHPKGRDEESLASEREQIAELGLSLGVGRTSFFRYLFGHDQELNQSQMLQNTIEDLTSRISSVLYSPVDQRPLPLPGHPLRHLILDDLLVHLKGELRYEDTQEESIPLLWRQLTSPITNQVQLFSSQSRMQRLLRLGGALQQRYSRLNLIDDLEDAIHCYGQAASMSLPSKFQYQLLEANMGLASSTYQRYLAKRQLEDLITLKITLEQQQGFDVKLILSQLEDQLSRIKCREADEALKTLDDHPEAGLEGTSCVPSTSAMTPAIANKLVGRETSRSAIAHIGSATSHVRRTPEAHHLRRLTELAHGLEHLHNRGFVHGDLRCDNAAGLLDSTHLTSQANLGKGKASPEHDDPRWLAPEVVLDKTLISRHSDVWSFGMVCLKILSGERPFAELENNVDVIRGLLKGDVPKRPGEAALEQGLSDAMWELLCRCWQKQPESRPPITEVKNTLLTFQGNAPAAELKPTKPPDHSASFPPTRAGRFDIHPLKSFETGFMPPNIMRMVLPRTDGDESSASTSGYSSSTTSHSSMGSASRSSVGSTSRSSVGLTSRSSVGSTSRSSVGSTSRSSVGSTSLSSAGSTLFHTSSVEHSSHKVQTSPLYHSLRPHFEDLPSLLPLPRLSSMPPLAYDKVTSRRDDYLSPIRDVIPSDSGGYAPPGSHEAVTTLAAVIALNISGTVLGGTLEGLLDRLITNINSDVNYRDTLFTACAELTTPDHLFSILSRRFYDAKRDPRKHPQEGVTIQFNVLVAMKHWLSIRSLSGQTQLLERVRSFCKSAALLTASKAMMIKITELIELIDGMGNVHPHRPSREMFLASQMRPRDLAIALTLLEGDKYTALTPTDYILYLKGYPSEHVSHPQGDPASRVEDAYTTHNLIVEWIKDSILCPVTVEGRAETCKFFINTAEECRKLCNFSSFVAIASALHSSPIARLKRTEAELALSVRKQLESLQELLSPSFNHHCYRKLLKRASNTEEQDRCVPWLSVHLEDLRLPLQEHPIFHKVDERTLIDFRRYIKFMDRIEDVLPYRAPDLESDRERGQLAYLEDQLHKTKALAKSDHHFMKRAEALEPNAKPNFNRNYATLRGLGFL